MKEVYDSGAEQVHSPSVVEVGDSEIEEVRDGHATEFVEEVCFNMVYSLIKIRGECSP